MARNRLMLFLTIFTLVLCCISPAPPASAEERDNVIAIGSPKEGWPPYLIVDHSHTREGFCVDLARKVAEQNGFQFKIAIYPERRARLLLNSGRIHTMLKAKTWMPNPDNYLWSDPIIESEDILLFRAGQGSFYSSLKDISGLEVGVVLGYGYPTLERMIKSRAIRTYAANNAHHQLGMLLRGRVDCVVINRLVARWEIRNSLEFHDGQFDFSTFPVEVAPLRMAFSKGRNQEKFVAAFNRELKKMKNNGLYQKIVGRYLKDM